VATEKRSTINARPATPLVSVVVTCFNYGRYLGRCLDSALRQSYPHLEVVVVDDGSTDDTEQVMDAYRGDPRLSCLRQENRGQAVAKNAGIRRSHGEFVAFLDADDLWCADKLEKQMILFDDQEVGVVYCRARYLDQDDHPIEYEMTGRYLQPQRGQVTEWLFYDNFVQFSGAVVRRECLERFGVFDESLSMGIDWDLWLRISSAYRFDFVDERLFYYRMGHAGQMSRNQEERQRCSDRIVSNFLERFPGLVPQETVRRALSVTCCHRGEYLRRIDRYRSYRYFFKALRHNPAELGAYKGLIKNLLDFYRADAGGAR
jgi:glycosyltransferase involved in cell wall biosynthesis